jgi:hypothetical protein
LQAKELPRPLKEALDTGRLSKAGQKRATTYFARGTGGRATTPTAGRQVKAEPPVGRKGRRSAPNRRSERKESVTVATGAQAG